MKKLILSAVVLSSLAGCGEGFLRPESSPAYVDGYNDGCTNGSNTAGNLTGQFVRDEARYNAEPDYAQGWLNGNRECNGAILRGNPNNTLEPIEIESPG